MSAPITLTTIGSRGLRIAVSPAALPEAGTGGIAIEQRRFEMLMIDSQRAGSDRAF